MTWTQRLRLLIGMLCVLALTAVLVLVFNQRQAQALSTTAQVLAAKGSVGAAFGGVVTDVEAKEGQDVKKGEPLFTVSSPDLQRDLSQGLKVASSEAYDVDTVSSTVTYKALNDGRLSEVKVPVGGFIQNGANLATIIEHSSQYAVAEFTLSPRDYERIVQGARVTLRLPDDSTVEGVVRRFRCRPRTSRPRRGSTIDSDALKDASRAELTHPGTPVAAILSLRDDGPLAGPTDALRDVPGQDRAHVMTRGSGRPGPVHPNPEAAASADCSQPSLSALAVAALAVGRMHIIQLRRPGRPRSAPRTPTGVTPRPPSSTRPHCRSPPGRSFRSHRSRCKQADWRKGLVPPTNRWFSSLALGAEALPVFPVPLSFIEQKTGFGFGVPRVTTSDKTILGGAVSDITVTVPALRSTVVSDYDDLTVTLEQRDSRGKALGHTVVAQGVPSVTFTATRRHRTRPGRGHHRGRSADRHSGRPHLRTTARQGHRHGLGHLGPGRRTRDLVRRPRRRVRRGDGHGRRTRHRPGAGRVRGRGGSATTTPQVLARGRRGGVVVAMPHQQAGLTPVRPATSAPSPASTAPSRSVGATRSPGAPQPGR